jgi:hypothetical protein
MTADEFMGLCYAAQGYVVIGSRVPHLIGSIPSWSAQELQPTTPVRIIAESSRDEFLQQASLPFMQGTPQNMVKGFPYFYRVEAAD